MNENIVSVKNLEIVYSTRENTRNSKNLIHAINDLSLDIKKGEILSVAGESGCGKSTLAKAIMKLVPIKSGQILLNGKNIESINKNDFYKNIQMVFQNPYSSLNPKMKIGDILREPLEINTNLKKSEMDKIIYQKIESVGLDKSSLSLYPHEFSGGQRQRIAIARSLILTPKFIIADEPVSALDVSIQAQIINLLIKLKNELNLTFLFISHDLSVIRYLSDRIAVMYLGEIVEQGLTEEIFENPKHPYTQILLNSAPDLQGKTKEKIMMTGELPSPDNLPNGCKFHPRCPFAMDICKENSPKTFDISATHCAKCFLCEKTSVL